MPKIIPDFWPASIQAINPTVVYEGPFPATSRDYYALTPGLPIRNAFVYVLTDSCNAPIYVGRARKPGNRFDKHRRRDWWSDVEGLILLRVDGADSREAHALVDYLERYLIRTHQPRNNIAGVPS